MKKQKCLVDFEYFFKEILGYEKSLSKTAHKEIVELLNRIDQCIKDKKGLEELLLMPRGTWKSTVFTVAGVNWLLTKHPELRILISNASLSNAEKFLDEIKRNFKKEEYISLFGDVTGDVWRTNEIRVKDCKRSGKEMSITIGSPTTSLVSQHFDIQLMDDLVNRESVNTIEQMEKTKQYAKDLIPLGQGGQTIKVFIGTRWHFGDLYQWLIDKGIRYILKSIYADKEETVSIFPEEFSIETINKFKKDLGSYDFSCHYKNNPVDDENADFKDSWLTKIYKEDFVQIEYSFAMLDFARSKDNESDFTGCVVVGIDKKNNWHLIYVKNYKLNITERIELLFDLWQKFKRYNLVAIGVEEKAFDDNIKPLFEPLAEQRGIFPNITQLKDRGKKKETRILGLVPRFEYGKIFFKEDTDDDTEILKDQLRRFPKSKNDDLSDALAYTQDMIEEFGSVNVTTPKEMQKKYDLTYLEAEDAYSNEF